MRQHVLWIVCAGAAVASFPVAARPDDGQDGEKSAVDRGLERVLRSSYNAIPFTEQIPVEGMVRDTDGRPVAEATVFVQLVHNDLGHDYEEVYPATIDRHGNYRVLVDTKKVLHGRVVVVARRETGAPGFVRGHDEGIPYLWKYAAALWDGPVAPAHAAALQERFTQDFKQPIEPRIVGDVVLPDQGGSLVVQLRRDGRPVDSGWVKLKRQDFQDQLDELARRSEPIPGEFDDLVSPTAVVDETGRAKFEKIPPGMYQVLAMNGGDRKRFESWSRYRSGWKLAPAAVSDCSDVGVAAGQERSVSLSVREQRYKIRARVFDPQGRLAEPEQLSFHLGGPVGGVDTEKRDEFVIEMNRPGFFPLRIYHAESRNIFPPHEFRPHAELETLVAVSNLRKDTPVIDFHVTNQTEPDREIDVRLFDLHRQPAPGTVSIRSRAPANPVARTVKTDIDGRAFVQHLKMQSALVAGVLNDRPPLPKLQFDIENRELRGLSVLRTVSVPGDSRASTIELHEQPVGYARGRLHPPAKRRLNEFDFEDFRSGLPDQGLPTEVLLDPETGRFIIGPLFAGPLTLKLRPKQTANDMSLPEWLQADFVIIGGEVNESDVAAEPVLIGTPEFGRSSHFPDSFSGIVRMHDGRTPAYGARVFHVVPREHAAVMGALCSADGRFVTHSAFSSQNNRDDPDPPGSPAESVLVAQVPGLTGCAVISIPADHKTDLNITLPRPISVSGKVTVAGRVTVEFDGQVMIRARHRGAGKLDDLMNVGAPVNDDGTFQLYGLTAGQYVIRALLDDVWSSDEVLLAVDGDQPAPLELDIPTPGAATWFEFRRANNKPLVDARIECDLLPASATSPAVQGIFRTDGRGKVRIDGCRARKTSLRVPAYHETFEAVIPEWGTTSSEPVATFTLRNAD